MSSSGQPHIVFGAGGIGTTAATDRMNFTYKFGDPETVGELFQVLDRLNIKELDSAASYPPGNPWNTETLLGESKAVEKGFTIDSKVIGVKDGQAIESLTYQGIKDSLDKTLSLTGSKKLRIFYSHFPQRGIPLAETAAGFDKVYRAGGFEKLGLCSYTVEEMREYFDICEKNGYVKPSVYQGHYNAIRRGYEDELLPLLRKHNCVFYAYSPLAGGFLTGKVTFANKADSNDKTLERTRWNKEGGLPSYANSFTHESYGEAIRSLKKVCDAANPPLSLQEATLRWVINHSALHEGDAIIVGATRIDQLESNVADCRKGPLPKEVLDEVDSMWEKVKGH